MSSKIRLLFGGLFVVGMASSLIYGWMLKRSGDAFNHIWILGLLFAVAALNQLQKAVKSGEDKEDS